MKIMASPVLIFTKLTKALQHLVLIYYTEFHLNLKINMQKYGHKFTYTLK